MFQVILLFDASMPAMIRSSGKMGGFQGKRLKDTKAVIPK